MSFEEPHLRAQPYEHALPNGALQPLSRYLARDTVLNGLVQAMQLLREQQDDAELAGETRLVAAEGYRFVVGRREGFGDMGRYPVVTGRYCPDSISGFPFIIKDEQQSQVETAFYADRLEVIQPGIAAVDSGTDRCRILNLNMDEVRQEAVPEPNTTAT
jgi:hypothetical protein